MNEFFNGQVDSFADIATVIVVSFLVIAITWIVVTAIFNYAHGRAVGGYPVLSKVRKRITYDKWFFNLGKNQSQKKIAKGGHK